MLRLRLPARHPGFLSRVADTNSGDRNGVSKPPIGAAHVVGLRQKSSAKLCAPGTPRAMTTRQTHDRSTKSRFRISSAQFIVAALIDLTDVRVPLNSESSS
jgi:hypothetical protein